MTMAPFRPCLRKLGVNLSHYNGKETWHRYITERDTALFLYNNHFWLIWKSEGVSFNQAIKELKDDFEIVDNFITEGNVISHFKFEFIPNKIESHLTNFTVYDSETHNTDRARPYCILFCRLCKIAGRYNLNLTSYENEKCKNDTLVYVGDDCITKALDFLLKFKRKERKT